MKNGEYMAMRELAEEDDCDTHTDLATRSAKADMFENDSSDGGLPADAQAMRQQTRSAFCCRRRAWQGSYGGSPGSSRCARRRVKGARSQPTQTWEEVLPLEATVDVDPVWVDQFPLSASGRHVVNRWGERYKLAGVNWYGASDSQHCLGGLDVQQLEVICETVRRSGFSVVRLPFSNQMLRSDVAVGAIDFDLNPRLRGLSAVEVLDEVIHALARQRVAVVLSNHSTLGEGCDGVCRGQNGLWFVPGDPLYTEAQWIEDWAMLARRYSRVRHVVGFDLRNEIRPAPGSGYGCFLGGLCCTSWPSWDNSPFCECIGHDWAIAARRLAERLLEISPYALLVVERILWPQSDLAAYAACPGPLLPRLRGRLVLGVHHYSWSGPGRYVPSWWVPRHWKWLDFLCRRLGCVTRWNYGDMSRSDLREQLHREWGSVLEAGLCPVWVSEFGADAANLEEMQWLEAFTFLLRLYDADWAYWPLNVGGKPGGGSEAYGFLTPAWLPKEAPGDPRLDLLKAIGLQPGLPMRSPTPSLQMGSETSTWPRPSEESDDRSDVNLLGGI